MSITYFDSENRAFCVLLNGEVRHSVVAYLF